MPLHKLKFTPTEGLSKEINTIDSWSSGQAMATLLPPLSKPEDYYSEELSKGAFKELEALTPLGTPLKILDVGVGTGKTSIFMAARGHSVSVVEPSSEQCRIIEGAAVALGLHLDIYEGPAEVIDQIGSKVFDLCFFNGALHHCDDPVLALKLCRQALKENGKLILLNEPILKLFRSKKWYFRQLEENPQKMGHYGGNEHIYYAWEYSRMLRKAGFTKVQSSPSQFLGNVRSALIHMATVNQCGNYLYTEKKLIQHTLWTIFISQLVRNRFFNWALSRFSLLPLTFQAASV